MADNSKLDEIKKSGHLPSPKGAALQVLYLCQKDDVTNHEVVYALQADPALSARLIKLANSPVSHQVRPVISVADAVTVLGLNTVRQLVLGLSLVDSSRTLKCKNFDYTSFWSHSLLRAIAAQNLVSLSCAGVIPGEEVFVLGLLGDIGSLALATAYPVEYEVILQQKLANHIENIVNLEQAEFGFDHNLLSKEMLADWRMPEIFQTAIQHYEDPTISKYVEGSKDWCLLNLLHVSDYLAKLSLSPEPLRSKMVSKLIFKATRLGIESKTLIQFCDKVIKEWHDWSKMFGIRVVDVPSFEHLLDMAPLAPEHTDAGVLPGNTITPYKLRILMVDDDKAVLMIMKMLLDSAGHTVAVAQNGVEALATLKEFKPQIVITDWVMPEMNGIELCKAIRRNPDWRNIYIFMLTSLESTDRLVEAFDAGANDYMTKPINAKVLGSRLSAGQRMVQLQEELEQDRIKLHDFSAELEESNKRLQQLVVTDELTGLHNRRFANEHLERQWAIAERNGTPLSCMMIDIDFFKRINDTYGHKVGDDVLKQVARALQISVRKQDVVCRLGGEEFLVICADFDPALLYKFAERMRQNVSDLSFTAIPGKNFKLTVSIGVANKTPKLVTPEMLLQLADRLLYKAKDKGRNRTVAE
jgi:two-component system cell cycle response regulator